jgi:hypothetical protein
VTGPKPKVIRRARGVKLPEGSVYVGRPTRWGNPFKIGEHGDRDEVIELYRAWLMAPEQSDLREQARNELAGKDLACWCAPDPCHADVLLEVANTRLRRPPAKQFLVAGAGNGLGYTTTPPREVGKSADRPEVIDRIREARTMRDEPETIGNAVVTITEVVRKHEKIAHAKAVQDAREVRKTLPFDKRLANAEHMAKRERVDARHELRVIARMHDRGGSAAVAAVRRLERLEEQLDGPIELPAA